VLLLVLPKQRQRMEALVLDLVRVCDTLVSLGGGGPSTASGGSAGGGGAGVAGAQPAGGSGNHRSMLDALNSAVAVNNAAAAKRTRAGGTRMPFVLPSGPPDAATLEKLLNAAVPANPLELKAALQSRRDDLQADLDRLIAAECLFCGDFMIDSVSEPFETDDSLVASAGATGEDWDV
jgi:hypothetical protein